MCMSHSETFIPFYLATMIFEDGIIFAGWLPRWWIFWRQYEVISCSSYLEYRVFIACKLSTEFHVAEECNLGCDVFSCLLEGGSVKEELQFQREAFILWMVLCSDLINDTNYIDRPSHMMGRSCLWRR